MAEPPPIPPPPAGFGWRSLACLADIIPLFICGHAVAGMVADADALAAYAAQQKWTDGLFELYFRSLSAPSSDSSRRILEYALNPPKEVVEAVIAWSWHLGTTTFLIMLSALTSQETLMGTTLGKRIFRLRTAEIPGGGRPPFLSCLMRSAWKSAFFALPNPFFGLLGIVNFHVPLFRKDRLAWHDLWTRTQVFEETRP